MKNSAEVAAIIAELERLYPDALCSLEYKKDYELLFAVRLSAQCTDARVNQVTPALFARFPTLKSFAGASEEEVGEYVHSCGFWRAKAHDLVACAQIYGQEGYVCDTHCIRITGRLGLTDGSKDPLRVEKQLRACLPPEKSSDFCHRMVLHGRAVCTARAPHCESCTLRPLCDMGRASD